MSGVVALTLSPMMCSHLLTNEARESRLVAFIDRRFEGLRRRYVSMLHGSLDLLPVTSVFAVILLGSIYFLYAGSKTELAPQEDQGVVVTLSISPPHSTLQQRLMYAPQVYDIFMSHPETAHVFQLGLPGQNVGGDVFKPWHQRKLSSNELQPMLQQELTKVAGAQIAAFQPPPLPVVFDLPVQFVIQTTDPFERLNDVAHEFLATAQKSGLFSFLDTDLTLDQPQAVITIDRDKTAQLGLRMSDVGASLTAMLGGGYVNYFSLAGRSYKVIPQVQQRYRLNAQQLLD